MLVLKTLTFENIGRFIETQSIDFTALGSLVQIEGKNNCSGGSSGAGKSTIFKALEFLLGLNDISNGVLQSRLTKEPMSVTGIFDLDGVPLKIVRDKKLLIDLDGVITTGSSKLTEELLDQLIGMPRDLFRKILHKRQGEGGFFLDMGGSNTHKFLVSCLGQEKEQEKVITLENIIKELTSSEEAVRSSLSAIKSGLEATQQSMDILGLPPTPKVSQETVEAFKLTHEATQLAHKQAQSRQNDELLELDRNRPKIKSTPFDRSKIERLEAEIENIVPQISALEKEELNRQNKIRSEIQELQVKTNDLGGKEIARQRAAQDALNRVKTEHASLLINVRDGNTAKEQAVVLAEELKKVRASLCPTCEQNWITDAAKAKDADIVNKLQDLKTKVFAGRKATDRINEILPEIDRLKEECHPQNIPELDKITEKILQLTGETAPKQHPGIQALKADRASKQVDLKIARQEEDAYRFNEDAKAQAMVVIHAQKQTELRAIHESAIGKLAAAEKSAFISFQNAQNELKSFEEASKRFTESSIRLNEQLSKYNNQLSEKQKELELIQEEVELATEAKKAIKTYLSCSFEDALESISDRATRLIRAIPNMSTATIQFEGLKETKEGKIKEEVTCFVSMDGEIGVPLKSLSGGERSSTDLAIDISIVKFIEERTGNGCSIFILDEAFTGLDSQNILEALEMLKECSVDKQLLIVDHNPVASQFIESRLTVVRDGLTSKIVQQ